MIEVNWIFGIAELFMEVASSKRNVNLFKTRMEIQKIYVLKQ